MPTYDYECPDGHRFELFQRMSDEPGAACPQCGEAAQRRISGGAGFLFKGEGFYITDYRSDAYKKQASADAPASSGDATSDSAPKSDAPSDGGSKTDSAPKSNSSDGGKSSSDD